MSGWRLQLLCAFIPFVRKFRFLLDTIFEEHFGHEGGFANKELTLKAFSKHTENMKAVIPPERLLVFDVKQGWGPLCQFLGVPVPDGVAFPRVNDATNFHRNMAQRRMQANILLLFILALLVLVVSLIAMYLN